MNKRFRWVKIFNIDNDDEKWKFFILLLQILILSTSPYADRDSAGQLEQFVATHNCNFVKLYPTSSVIPKLHYAVHLAKQILIFGPLRHQWEHNNKKVPDLYVWPWIFRVSVK
jgi:hypothetical protein